MKNHVQNIQKAKECIYMLLESHRELLSGDEIEALENTLLMLEEYAASIKSEAHKDKIQSFIIEVTNFIARIAFKIFVEE